MKTAAVFRLFRSFNEMADCAKAEICWPSVLLGKLCKTSAVEVQYPEALYGVFQTFHLLFNKSSTVIILLWIV